MSFDTPDFDVNARQRDNARPIFFTEAVQNKAASEKEGRPVFFDREMVRILVPGDRLTESVQIVGDAQRQRWPREYAAFQQNKEAPLSGTPLSQMPGMTASQVEELRFSKVLTIEDLAALPDDLLSKVAPMNGKELRAKAQRWIEATNGAAPMEKLAAENDQLKTMMAEMQARMEAMEKAQAAQSAKAAE